MGQPSKKRLILLENANADADYAPVEWTGGGMGTLQVSGTFDDATVTIKGSLDGGETWLTPIGAIYKSAEIVPFRAGAMLVRAVVSGKGASTDLNCYLQPPDIG
jgi:hypothetical protein